jgi:hypothetical protein
MQWADIERVRIDRSTGREMTLVKTHPAHMLPVHPLWAIEALPR